MTKTNEHLSTTESQGVFSFQGENHAFKPSIKPKNYSYHWKQVKPLLIKLCFICDQQIKVKYIPLKEKYSQKNLWGYWTQKQVDKHKYICNSCIMKLHIGKMTDWITNKDKAGDFYQYVYRGQFKQE